MSFLLLHIPLVAPSWCRASKEPGSGSACPTPCGLQPAPVLSIADLLAVAAIGERQPGSLAMQSHLMHVYPRLSVARPSAKALMSTDALWTQPTGSSRQFRVTAAGKGWDGAGPLALSGNLVRPQLRMWSRSDSDLPQQCCEIKVLCDGARLVPLDLYHLACTKLDLPACRGDGARGQRQRSCVGSTPGQFYRGGVSACYDATDSCLGVWKRRCPPLPETDDPVNSLDSSVAGNFIVDGQRRQGCSNCVPVLVPVRQEA